MQCRNENRFNISARPPILHSKQTIALGEGMGRVGRSDGRVRHRPGGQEGGAVGRGCLPLDAEGPRGGRGAGVPVIIGRVPDLGREAGGWRGGRDSVPGRGPGGGPARPSARRRGRRRPLPGDFLCIDTPEKCFLATSHDTKFHEVLYTVQIDTGTGIDRG